MLLHWIIIGFSVTLAVIIAILAETAIRQEKRGRFGNRRPQQLDDVYREYYAESGIPMEVVTETFTRVADSAEIAVELLLPSDRFDHELAPVMDRQFDDTLGALEQEFLKELPLAEAHLAKDVKTIDDLVRIVYEYIKPTRCRQCRYPLRGLPIPRCPECGTSFAPSDQ